MTNKDRAGAWIAALGKYKYAALVALVGLVLLLWPSGAEKDADSTATPGTADPFAVGALEEKLSSALSRVEGAGEVTVVLTLDATAGRVLAREESTTEGSGRSESRSEVVLASKGSGTQEPVSLYTEGPSYRGALVISPGGGDPEVRLALTRAVSALTGLGADKISICIGK